MHMRGYLSDADPDVAIIIPSTGRAEQCARLVERIHETSRTKPFIVISVELGDVKPYAHRLAATGFRSANLVWDQTDSGQPGSHVAAINRGAQSVLAEWFINENESDPKLIIKLDDDHWPITPGWDQFYLDSLNILGGTGVVYGNDLHQGEALPTVPGLSANIVRELGWYAPPQLGHLFCDNFWLELGRRSSCLSYMPHVIIEHRHPNAGKASNDDTYQQGGRNEGRWIADEAEWAKITGQDLEALGGTLMDHWAGKVAGLAVRTGRRP